MPNIIELNLLNNKSIVATMQGHPLANENSYKIIAGEENATIFSIKSLPNQYANARLTVEMVNAQGLGIAERELTEIEVDLISYKGFILPVGMAVAGYGYVSIKAYIGDEVAVFQPLKLKVWNTLPNWKDGISNESSLKIENGHLYSNVNGVWIDIGNVGGEVDKVLSLESENAIQNKAVTIALSEKVNAEDYNNDIDDIRNDVKNLYAITAQGGLYTMLEVEQAFVSRETADGENIVDGQYTAPTKIQGSTVAYENVLKNAYFKGIKSTGKNLFNPERELSSFSATLNTSLRDFDETKVYVGMACNNYVNLSAVTNVSYIDGVLSFTTVNNAGYGVGIPFKVKPNTQYSISYRLISGSNVVLGTGFFNKNGAITKFAFSNPIFTTPTDCTWLLLVISNNTAGSISYTDIQLEESSAATAYEPYKEDIYELPEAVELAFGDTLDIKNRKIINNGYTEVINIADKVCAQPVTAWRREGFFSFYAIDALSKIGKLGAPHRITAICTNGFSQGSWQFDANTFENGTERYILTGNENKILYVIMPNSDLGVTQEDTVEVKIAAAKEWFANNPTTVRYITVDTTEYPIETPERYQAWKNGSETVVQGDTDNSEYGAMPTVTTEYFKLTEV